MFKKRIFTLDGEKVEGVFPVFNSKFDVKLPENLYKASDEEQMKYQEYLNSLVDLKLEKITTEVEVKIRVNDIELTRLEYMLKKLQREGAAAADEIKNIAD